MVRYPSSTSRCLRRNRQVTHGQRSLTDPGCADPFEHGLTYFAQSLTRGQAKIVAIGSSTTAGDGQIKAYPERVLAFLQVDFPKAGITMVNKEHSGQEAPIELLRFPTDVIAENPNR